MQKLYSDIIALKKMKKANQFNFKCNELEKKLKRIKLFSFPLRLDIVPTTFCNMDCIFCIKPKEEKMEHLSLANFKKIAKILFPYAIKVVYCSGGEPFLNKNFMEFLEISKRHSLFIQILSNGNLLTKKVCEELVQKRYFNAIGFSLDGASKKTVESIRRGIDYEKVIENIRLLCALKRKHGGKNQTITIRFAAMKRNIGELPEMIRLACTWGADKIAVKYVNVANGISPDESLFFHRRLTEVVFRDSLQLAKNLNIEIQLPALITTPSKKITHLCSYPWEFIKIDPDGKIRFCYKAWDNPVGNFFNTEDFRAIWNNKQYQLIRKSVNNRKNTYFKYCLICSEKYGVNSEYSHIKNFDENLYGFDENRISKTV